MPETSFSENAQRDPEHRISNSLERLNGKDLRVLLLWILAGLLGIGVAYRYFFSAFPEAAVDFQVTRGAAHDRARAFAEAQGAQLQDYKSSVVFGVDDQEKIYLEREVGLEQANRLMSSEVSVWYWQTRFFRPLQREEFRVGVDPGGRIVSYNHVLEEAAPGARLERDAALARAEEFLRGTLSTPLDQYTFLAEESNSVVRPNRTDWSFTWERSGFRAKEAPYRLRVGLQGEGIGGYEEFLKVPEAWQRDYAALRSSNNFIVIIAMLPYALLLGAALSVTITLGRSGLARWDGALKLGLVIAGLYFLAELNQWPLTLAGYDTNGSYSSFWLGRMGAAIATSVALALLVVMTYVPGEPLYRHSQPGQLRMGKLLSLPGLRSKEFFSSTVIGVCLACAHIGFVVLFYVWGRRFGVWAPQDLQYSDILSTALPWLYPLSVGVYASASEEFLFRLFAIPFLLRTTKSKFLAIVIPAFAWGFLHANYPQEPAYIRGIEVGFIGIVAGVVMLRWGIWATLIWHYSVDAFLVGLSLMRSQDLYSQLSGAVVGFAAPILVGVAGALYLARGGFAPSAELLNRAAPLAEIPAAAPAEAVVAAPIAEYAPLGKRALAILGVGGLLGAALLWGVKPAGIGDFVRFSIHAGQAEARADDVLRQRQVDPTGYHRVATIQYTFSGLANEYLRRNIGIEATNRIYRDAVPSAFWGVRYFRDSEKEEYLVVLLPDGGLHSVHHTLPEAAPGPNLSKEEAEALAADFLRRNFLRQNKGGLELDQWKVVEARSAKLPARTDHTFTWEQTASLIPEGVPAEMDAEGAHVRVRLQVQGAEVSGYRIFVHVPEEWVRRQNQDTLAGTAQFAGMMLFVAVFVIAVLVIFFRSLRHSAAAAVPWRGLARGLIVVLIAALANFAMQGPQHLTTYITDQPFSTFAGIKLISLSLAAVMLYSITVLLLGLAVFFLARRHGHEHLTGWRNRPRVYYRDAFWVGLCGSVTLLGLQRVSDWTRQVWPVWRHAFPATVPEGLDTYWPALHALAGAVIYGFLVIGVLALALGFASSYLRPAWVQGLLLAVLAVLMAPRWGSGSDFVQSALLGFVGLAVIWWGAQRLVRFNLLGYILVTMLLSLAAAAPNLVLQPNSWFRDNGLAIGAAAAVLLLWPLVARWSGTRGETTGTSQPY